MEQPTTQWDNLAEKYGKQVLSQEEILWPGISKLFKIAPGDSVLDVGCGDGRYCKLFHQQGAAQVLGIDTSTEQIQKASTQYPGPTYLQTYIEDLNTHGIKFSKLLANMLVCNLESRGRLDSFFGSAHERTSDDAELLVTNVSPEFQRSVETPWLIHQYPEQAIEGSEIHTSLSLGNGQWLGPFTNYHWSNESLIDSAQLAGWSLSGEHVLHSTTNRDDTNLPTYTAYTFTKHT